MPSETGAGGAGGAEGPANPVADRRPRVLAAVIGALVFPANKDWQASDTESPEDLAAAFDAYANAVIPALAGRWT